MNAETFETTIVASEENVNADSTIALFQSLEKSYPLASSLYLVVYNARYHFSKSVMEYLQDSRIKLVRLPPYSPELNLIERLWKVLKKRYYTTSIMKALRGSKKYCQISLSIRLNILVISNLLWVMV